MWTVADYAVQIDGLARGQEADTQEQTLRQDLQRIGFREEEISHIEMGCGCRKEAKLLRRIQRMRVRAQELGVRVKISNGELTEDGELIAATAEGGAPAEEDAEDAAEEDAAAFSMPLTKEQHLLEKTKAELRQARHDLESLRDDADGHVTTGQAFIVFQLETRRNEFIRLFEPQFENDEDAGRTDGDAATDAGAGGAAKAARVDLLTGSACSPAGPSHPPEGDEGTPPALAAASSASSLVEPPGLQRGTTRRKAKSSFNLFDLMDGEEHTQPLLEASNGAEVEVSVAPEPSDVLWENLEVTSAERQRATVLTYIVTLLIVTASAALFVVLTIFKNRGAEWFGFTPGTWAFSLFKLALSGSASGSIVGVNGAIFKFVYAATKRERHATKTGFERSLFTKLSLAYVANTVLLPILVGSVPYGMTQGWYEAGGPVEQALLLLITSTAFVEASKVLQPKALLQRHVLASPSVPPKMYAASQLRMNHLWAPPPMNIGELLASTLKTISLVLMYAPLYPPFYVVGALALAVSLGANRFAVSRWWGRPPSVGEEMIDRLRNALGLLFPVYLVTTAWGWSLADRRDKSLTALMAPFAVMIVLWALLQLLRFRGWTQYLAGCAIGPYCRRSRWYLKPYDPLGEHGQTRRPSQHGAKRGGGGRVAR